jgi:hypothetical protein
MEYCVVLVQQGLAGTEQLFWEVWGLCCFGATLLAFWWQLFCGEQCMCCFGTTLFMG